MTLVRRRASDSIETNDKEARKHISIPLKYRTVWIAKAHLAQPVFGPSSTVLYFTPTVLSNDKEFATHVCCAYKKELSSSLMLNKVQDGRRLEDAGEWEVGGKVAYQVMMRNVFYLFD